MIKKWLSNQKWKQAASYHTYQTFSGKHFPLISTFTPFWHLIKPLVEIFCKKMMFQTFREIRPRSKKALQPLFHNIFFQFSYR